jgi:DNA polymerase-3 subunit gamma/tau
MTQALYRKWRPQTFEQVVGQEHVTRTLRNALDMDRVHHAYLFTGPRGTGKTTTARLLAKAVNCLDETPANRPCNACAICTAVNEGRLMDLIEIDAASNTGVDDVRELRERIGYRPNEARYKVYVIDEVHMLSTSAFNALLKTLEEPPPHAIFVLATTEPQKIPATVLSRCQRFDFRRIPLVDVVARLRFLADQEHIIADDEALIAIARQGTGSMRDAESLLDQLAAYAEGGITVEVVQAALGTGNEEAVMALVDALADGDAGRGLAVINEAIDRGADPRQFARQVVDHLRALLLTRLGSTATPLHLPEGLREAFQAQAGRFSPRQLSRAARLFNEAALEARAAWQPQLPLELALIDAALPSEPAPPAHPAPVAPAPAAARPTPPAAAPRPQPPPRPSPAAAPGGDPPSLEQVKAQWAQFRRMVRQKNILLEAVLSSGRPLRVEQNALIIGFDHSFHKGRVEEEANRRLIEEVLSRLFGCPMSLRCEIAAAQPAAAAAEQDELVQAAVKEFGARVVEMKTTE